MAGGDEIIFLKFLSAKSPFLKGNVDILVECTKKKKNGGEKKVWFKRAAKH